ncbi:MAG: ABC transporter permease [Alphaproteobacteria bacterium]|nr:ABC transporter permease [Alphaproteobacteria bacterium]TAD88207.1 MAG: ABC transporter permease [Alphaproteobacteria bacterium]
MAVASAPALPSPVGRRRAAWLDFIIAQPLGAVALFVVLVMALAAIFADVVAPYDPLEIDWGAMLSAPSMEHPFGTDSFGRDIFTRVIYGARTALAIGLLSSLIGCTLGAAIGIASAYFGGRVDMVVQRLVDMFLAFPIIVLALVVVAILGRLPVLGVDMNLVLAIAVPIVPKVARVIRSSALTIVTMPYIDAARTAGYSHLRIILRHIAPNVAAPYLILLTAFIAQAILLEASLSFLGLGVTEPTPAWGLMLSGNASDFYREAPWMILFPGLAISLAVFAFNLFGDALRDWLDPKFKT